MSLQRSQPPEPQPSRTSPVRPTTRRGFLKTAALGGGVALAAGCEYKTQLFLLSRPETEAEQKDPSWETAHVRDYRTLGRTGMQVSDISFGCAGLDDADVVRRAIDRGINYFDTSPDYSRAYSEKTLGDGIRDTPREKLFVVSKFCTPSGHLSDDTPVREVMAAVEASLKRIGTDYLDLAHIHACNSIERLMNPNIHEAFDRLKEQGKLRFLGVSSHTPRLERVMRHAVDSGRFDVIMVAYNFRNWPELPTIFRDAKRKGVGVVAMKTLKGARHTVLSDFSSTERETFSQAAFKWVLSNPDVSGLVVTIGSYAQIDEYLHASGQPFRQTDLALLEKYDRLIEGDYCPPGCGDCLSSCPADVPVDDVLRFAMYYENYGQERFGMEEYAKLDPAHNASQCVGCRAPCEAACPHDVPIQAKLLKTDRLLRLA